MDDNLTPEQLFAVARDIQAVKLYALAATVMLWYDTLLTFAEEVEKIWQRPWTFATLLWALNRYVPLFGYIVVTVSFHMPWSKQMCNRYILYPEALELITSTVIDVIFILRIYAIYARNRTVLISLCILLLLCIGTKIWAFTDGTSLSLPPGLVGCILLGAHPSSQRFVYTWIADLIFDTVVFAATLYRTLSLYKQNRDGPAIPLLTIILRDGIIYFAIIFVSNFATVLMFLFARRDLKPINATFSILITNVMVSHLMLNLRGANNNNRLPGGYRDVNSNMFSTKFESNLIGNLGNQVESEWDSGRKRTTVGEKAMSMFYDAEATPRIEVEVEVSSIVEVVSVHEGQRRSPVDYALSPDSGGDAGGDGNGHGSGTRTVTWNDDSSGSSAAAGPSQQTLVIGSSGRASEERLTASIHSVLSFPQSTWPPKHWDSSHPRDAQGEGWTAR